MTKIISKEYNLQIVCIRGGIVYLFCYTNYIQKERYGYRRIIQWTVRLLVFMSLDYFCIVVILSLISIGFINKYMN